MDARSIAATAANGGYLTAASEICDTEYTAPEYHFDQGVYDKRVYNGWGHPEPDYVPCSSLAPTSRTGRNAR